jgi:hypothetical protein
MMIWIMTKPGAFAEDDENVISDDSVLDIAEANDEEDGGADTGE